QDTLPFINVCQPGDYSVSSSLCGVTSEVVHVIQSAAPFVAIISLQADTLTSSVTDTNFVYQWYVDSLLIAGANSPTLILPDSGCFYLIISDTLGCSSQSNTICNNNNGIRNIEIQNFISVKSYLNGSIEIT